MVLIIPLFEMHQPRRLKRQFGRPMQPGTKLENFYFDDDLNKETFLRVSRAAYQPVLDAIIESIERWEFKCAICMSGTLLEQAAAWSPELVTKIRRIVDTGSCELIAQPYYSSLSCLVSPEELAGQLEMTRMAAEKLFKQSPRTAKNTGLISREDVWKVMRALGFKSAIIEGTERLLGFRSPNCLYASADDGLKLLPRNYPLSDMVNFRFTESGPDGGTLQADHYLDLVLSQKGDLVLLTFNMEAFGEYFGEQSGIMGFLRSLQEEVRRREGATWATPAEAAEILEPKGEVEAKDYSSGADSEKDLSAWVGNDLQQYCFDNLRYLYPLVKKSADELRVWRLLGQSDNFLYMSHKRGVDGEIRSYFSHFSSPVEAFSTFMWTLADFRSKLYAKLGEDARSYRVLYGDLPDAHAFHFYAGMGKPLGVRATNLNSLRAAIQSVDEDCLRFHLSRGDLRRWIGEVLGLPRLAEEVRQLECGADAGDVKGRMIQSISSAIEEVQSKLQPGGARSAKAGTLY
ncbi:MAG: hypothetical protein QFX34_04820 [Candidatus Verstraetearchaeota archaeon]|nr:hypothetical protein [Candidatus Verstraetearchaeota archaeon]